MRVALNQRERLVAGDISDFKQRGALSGQHGRSAMADVVKVKIRDPRGLEPDVPMRIEVLIWTRQAGELRKHLKLLICMGRDGI